MLTFCFPDAFEPHPVGNSSFVANASNSQDILGILIEVPKAKQIKETWKLFRMWLTNSTNKFINATPEINVEVCRYILHCK